MYPVSAAYKTAIQQNVRDVGITGTITLKDSSVINVADADIVQGSLYITEQCVSGEDIEVGNVYAAEMGLSLTTPLDDPYALDGARILLNFGLKVGTVWEYVPLGYFYVTEIERKALNVKLTALDGMLLFDVPCGQPGPGTPAGFVAHACSIAGVTLANAAEVATFANASIGVGEPGEKVKTCRDLLMWACQLMGAFARMDRQGQLEIVPITMRASVKTINKAERYKSDVSDFGVKITQIAMTVGETEYSRGTPGMIMALEENPMMAGLDASQINTVLDNLRAQVTKAVYVPFNSDFIGDPALQPGDYITIKDAGILESETETFFYSENSPLEVQHNFVTSMITHSTWRYRGAHNIKAVGKSAIVRGVQQQQDKALSAISVLAKMAQSVAFAANQSTQLIKDAMGGHVLIRQAPDETNEILIMDHPDPEQAVKIWRWNMGGLGYSDNCTGADNPERTYTVAITMDGAINANFIKAGMIGAQYIQIGQATTFEEGYDPSKTQPVGMAADSNCTGLWHFDGSLNSHKGLAAIFDGEFANSKWGQGLNVESGKTLKIPAADILHPEESSINMRVYNLASSSNGSVIFDLGDSDGNQAVKVGIANDGRLFIEDKKAEYVVTETTQADFNAGALTDVISNPTGDLTLAVAGTNFAVTEDTQAEFEAGTLTNTEVVSDALKLDYTPGVVTYGTDFTGGKTYSADSETLANYSAAKAFDNDEATAWNSANTAFPHWLRVDLGSGGTKIARKLRIKPRYNEGAFIKDFVLEGSNNGSDWTNIHSGVVTNANAWSEFTFENATAYRHHGIYATSSYITANNVCAIAEIELMEAASEEPGTYALSGTWEKEYDLSAVGVARGSLLSWSATTPANTSVAVQAAVATDGINYGSYSNCTSGSAIPGITAGMDLSSAKMKVKVTLTTTDDSVTPSLDSLAIAVNSAYKASGNRVHVYDISGVGIAELSSISWDATLPTGTSLVVKAAVSTDGGLTYGAFQNCTSGQAIPVLTEDMDISNARLKIQEDLATTDYSVTPKLNSLTFNVSKVANIAYGANKSALTGWDNIAIQWKPERLSLIVNGEESAFVENPGQVAALSEYAYIGSDRAGTNQINTTVDELRIDRIYQPIEKVLAWHIVDAPFYTSEEFKQWPGYVKVETDGLKVYDSTDVLRVLLGSWMNGVIRKYGLKIFDGEIYSSIIRSGAEDADDYIQFNPPNSLEVYGTTVNGAGYKVMAITAPHSTTADYLGGIEWYSEYGSPRGSVYNADNNIYILATSGDVITNGLSVFGDITKTGSCSYAEPTDDYGTRLLYIVETPELLYYDRGVTNLINGEATIMLDPIFLQCIEPDAALSPWQVWVECYGENGVYVTEVGEDYFKVKERNSGTSSNKVIWRLEATRKNYAGIRLMEVVR